MAWRRRGDVGRVCGVWAVVYGGDAWVCVADGVSVVLYGGGATAVGYGDVGGEWGGECGA